MSLNKFSQYPARTELNPTPRIEQTNLVAVTSDNKDTLVPADQLIPGVAYNATDGDPRPMISGEVWNEQEQIREAFTAGPAFALPHFRYVADDYFWKSIAKDKAFYYLTDMKLLTYPLTWDPSTSTSAATPALHLSWLRAPDQTQIFKFIDGTSSSLGAIILQNRTYEMVSADPEEVRVNQCSTSTKLKEVQVTVNSTDGSPLYVNFPDADVSLTIAQANDTLSNIKLSSDATSDVSWRTLTINTRATTLSNMFTGATGSKVCAGTVYLNAPNATSVTDCFGGDYQVGDGVTGTVPDVRAYLPDVNTSFSFYENFPLGEDSIIYLLQNIKQVPTEQQVIKIGVNTIYGKAVERTSDTWELTRPRIKAAVEALIAASSGNWAIDWNPIDATTGREGIVFEVYDILEHTAPDDTFGYLDTKCSFWSLNTKLEYEFYWPSTSTNGFVIGAPLTNYKGSSKNGTELLLVTGISNGRELGYIYFYNQVVNEPTTMARVNLYEGYSTTSKVYDVWTTVSVQGATAMGYQNGSLNATKTLPDTNLKENVNTGNIVIRKYGIGSTAPKGPSHFKLRYMKVTTDGTLVANLLPCKYVGPDETYKDWPGLYDTMRTNTSTAIPLFTGTHFFPANAKDAFTCYYETTTQTAEA